MSCRASPDDVDPSALGACPAELVELRPISIDDWAAVRYVHKAACRTGFGPRISPRCIEAFMAMVDTPAYMDRLQGSDLVGAWLSGQLAGTAGWRPVAGQGHVARIEGLFVQPLFSFMGLGSLLLAQAEARARKAGYGAITVLAPANAVPFFMRLGYDIYAQGAGVSDLPSDMPVSVMRKREPAAVTVFPNGSRVPSPRAHAGLAHHWAVSAHRLLVDD
ncbi:MAG: GNAT family N-acetyltransferase [Hyphomicrobiaceae bacterium]